MKSHEVHDLRVTFVKIELSMHEKNFRHFEVPGVSNPLGGLYISLRAKVLTEGTATKEKPSQILIHVYS